MSSTERWTCFGRMERDVHGFLEIVRELLTENRRWLLMEEQAKEEENSDAPLARARGAWRRIPVPNGFGTVNEEVMALEVDDHLKGTNKIAIDLDVFRHWDLPPGWLKQVNAPILEYEDESFLDKNKRRRLILADYCHVRGFKFFSPLARGGGLTEYLVASCPQLGPMFTNMIVDVNTPRGKLKETSLSYIVEPPWISYWLSAAWQEHWMAGMKFFFAPRLKFDDRHVDDPYRIDHRLDYILYDLDVQAEGTSWSGLRKKYFDYLIRWYQLESYYIWQGGDSLKIYTQQLGAARGSGELPEYIRQRYKQVSGDFPGST